MDDENQKPVEPRWRGYVLTIVLLPMMIPVIGFWLRAQGRTDITLQMIAGAFMIYWVAALIVGGLLLRSRLKIRIARLGSPLVDLPLTADMRTRLSDFAAARRQSLAVTAFDLLDRQ